MRKEKTVVVIFLGLCFCLWSCAPKGKTGEEQAGSLSEAGAGDVEIVSAGAEEKAAENQGKQDEISAPEEIEKSGSTGNSAEAGRTGRSEKGNRSGNPQADSSLPSSSSVEKEDENKSMGYENSAGEGSKEDSAGEADEEAAKAQFTEAEGEGDYDF